MQVRIFLIIGFFMTLLTGCQGMSSANNNRDSLFDSWTLAQADSLQNIPDNILLILSQQGEKGVQVSGFSGVNRITGKATLDTDQQLSFGPLASTRMMGPEPRMTFEGSYLKALQTTQRYQLDNNQLTLFNKEGKKLVFNRGID